MPRPPVTDSLEGFSGLNTASDPMHLGPTEMARAVNAKWTLYKGLTPRLGTQRVNTSVLLNSVSGSIGNVQNLMVWQSAPGGIPQLIVIAAGQLFTAPMQGPPPWTFTNQGSCSTQGYPSLVAFTDASVECVYVGDPAGVWKWTGSVLTHNAVANGFGQLCVQNQRLFGILNNPNLAALAQTLSWSSLNNGDDVGIPTGGHPERGGSAIIRTFGESFLTDLMAFGPGLAIAHLGGISMFTGWSQNDISIQSGTQGISADTGCFGPRSMCAVENFGFIVSPRGGYVLSPWGMLQQISKPVENLWPTIAGGLLSGAIVQGVGPVTVHDSVNHCVYVITSQFNPPVTGPTSIYGYNYRTEGWFGPWNFSWGQTTGGANVSPTAICTGYDSAGTYYVLCGAGDGYVRRLEVPGLGLDDVQANGTGGTFYTMSALTRPMFCTGQTGQPLVDQEKAWRWVDVQAQLRNPQGANVTVVTYPNEGVVSANLDNLLSYNNQPDMSPRNYRVQTGSRGQAVQLAIHDIPSNNPAGQNVYMTARAYGFSYGRRF